MDAPCGFRNDQPFIRQPCLSRVLGSLIDPQRAVARSASRPNEVEERRCHQAGRSPKPGASEYGAPPCAVGFPQSDKRFLLRRILRGSGNISRRTSEEHHCEERYEYEQPLKDGADVREHIFSILPMLEQSIIYYSEEHLHVEIERVGIDSQVLSCARSLLFIVANQPVGADAPAERQELDQQPDRNDPCDP